MQFCAVTAGGKWPVPVYQLSLQAASVELTIANAGLPSPPRDQPLPGWATVSVRLPTASVYNSQSPTVIVQLHISSVQAAVADVQLEIANIRLAIANFKLAIFHVPPFANAFVQAANVQLHSATGDFQLPMYN